MGTSPDGDWNWTPDPLYPTNPEFYRRVLHHMPTPILVVNGVGEVMYVNQALQELGGWDLSGASRNVLDHVHPADRDGLTMAFLDIVQIPSARVLGSGGPWATIHFRIIAGDGTIIPIDLVGVGGLMDPEVEGIIYQVRPTQDRTMLGRVLDGLSQGASMHHLLTLVATTISDPPLDLEAVILRSTPSDSWVVAASTSPELTDAVRGDSQGLPWHAPAAHPLFVNVADMAGPVGNQLRDAGFEDLWHVAVESPLTANTLRIIAVCRRHHIPTTGPRDRMSHARELGAAVLLRSEADVLLEYAANNDRLTDLPNRAAFYQRAEAVDPLAEHAALYIELEGVRQAGDAFGQATGDAVVQIAADRLRVISGPSCVAGRMSDNQFAVLLGDASDDLSEDVALMDRSLELASELLQALEDPIVVAGRLFEVSASIGVAVSGSGISIDHLLTWADAAMHDAKRSGGSQICRYGVAFN